MFINAVMYDGSIDRPSLSVPVMYGLFFAGEGCRECVRDWVVGVGAYGACSDSAKWCVTLT